MAEPKDLVKAGFGIGKLNSILNYAVLGTEVILNTKEILDIVNNDLGAVKDKLNDVGSDIEGLPDTIENSTNSLRDFMDDCCEKISNIQYILTSSFGNPSPIQDWPVLDMRPTADNIPRWYPNNSTLMDWLRHAAGAVVPTREAGRAFLGHVSGPATFLVAAGVAVITEVTEKPAGSGTSRHPSAGVAEFLGYVSWRALGAFTAPVHINHDSQLWIPNGFQPDAIAIEPRIGVELDCWSVVPTAKVQ